MIELATLSETMKGVQETLRLNELEQARSEGELAVLRAVLGKAPMAP
jgi:hypothetical protein